MAKDLDGTGVTANVLVPGGVTNTPMISDEAGFDRNKLIQPEVMVPPLFWLVSQAAAKVAGRRFLGVHWEQHRTTPQHELTLPPRSPRRACGQ
jgi:hypothetical protein